MDISSRLQSLPDEILLNILSFLDSTDIASLQALSKHFKRVCRDNTFWRSRCLVTSASLERIQLYRLGSDWVDEAGVPINNNNALSNEQASDRENLHWSMLEHAELAGSARRGKEHTRIVANWDRTFPGEQSDWYDEYIHRHAPIVVNWLQQPQEKDDTSKSPLDVGGVALFDPSLAGRELFAVSPLENGSVCLWDIKGSRGKKGSIVAQSSPVILPDDGSDALISMRFKMITTGITECVSIDSQREKAFFAAQSRLVEVDLNTLRVVRVQAFERPITTLSKADPTVPLTVGTMRGLHLFDFRARNLYRNDLTEKVDPCTQMGSCAFPWALDPKHLSPYALLEQAGPQSIVHLERPSSGQISDDIFAAGRFSNILHYERRMFPKIKGSLHSGARLCSLASLPYPFSTLDSDLRRQCLLSVEQVEKSKNAIGRTLIACGEYNTKGSLEMYGLGSDPATHDSTLKNRQTASKSKLLSVINHGNRIVFSDGQGYLKWVERDGFTEVRCHKIGKSDKGVQHSLFDSSLDSDDIARKILSTQATQCNVPEVHRDGDLRQANNNDILFWTGEKLGLVSFSSKPGFSADDFEDNTKTPEEIAAEDEEKLYSERMRLALEREAVGVRFAQNLGAGSIRNGY